MNDVVKRLLELSQSMMEGYPLNDGDFTDIDEAIMLIERLIRERDSALHELKAIRSGFEGCCHACEPVGALNQTLRDENAKLRRHMRSLQNYIFDRIVKQDEELGLL